MILHSLSGEQVDAALTGAMQTTIGVLVQEGLLTEEQALEFIGSHVCRPVYPEQGFMEKVFKKFGWNLPDQVFRVTIFKVMG